MRKLIDTPNIGAASSTYPDGVIVDNAGPITGTALSEILYGDLMQAVHKLKRLAAITENNLPDNETNGFQLITALFAQGLPTWQATTAKVDFSKTKWVSHANGIYYHKTTASTDTPPATDTTNWFRVFYWDGAKIVYSDEARIAGIESAIAALDGRIDPLEVYLAPAAFTYGTGFSSSVFPLAASQRGHVVQVSGDFIRNSGTSSTIATPPVGFQKPLHPLNVSAINRSTGASVPIRIADSTGTIYAIGGHIVNGETYDLHVTYLI